MAKLNDLLPNGQALLELEPEELAGYLLEYLNSLPPDEKGGLSRHNFNLPHTVQHYPADLQRSISLALMEAWVWLEREGLLIPQPGVQGDWRTISRRGARFKSHADVNAFHKASILPRGQLHPAIAVEVGASFVRGAYDTAIFQAFRPVEIAVRDAGGYAVDQVGVPLMRKAFHPDTGPLTDTVAPTGERQALADLFAGAIGTYKNPSSHRRVPFTPEVAAELIMMASHLLRLVDARSAVT